MENTTNLPTVQNALFALSGGLSIRYVQTYYNQYTGTWDSILCYKPASQDIQLHLQIGLQNILDSLKYVLSPSDYICLSYSFGRIRGGTITNSGTLVESVSPKLQEALLSLPKLEKGETYCFCEDTSISFELTADRTYKVEATSHQLSPWIAAKLFAN